MFNEAKVIQWCFLFHFPENWEWVVVWNVARNEQLFPCAPECIYHFWDPKENVQKCIRCISDTQGCVPGYGESQWEFPLYYVIEEWGGSVAGSERLISVWRRTSWAAWAERTELPRSMACTTAWWLEEEIACVVWAGGLTCWLIVLMGTIMQ